MIYIMQHKECILPTIEGYCPLGIGELFDGKKDNINDLNPYINEATGLYELWKHCKDDIIGLAHYRRYFVKDKALLALDMAKDILKNYDIIITPTYRVGNGIYTNLRSEMGNETERKVLDKYYNLLCEKEPGLKKWFDNTGFNPREMFVCKKELIDKYCEWLFPIMIPLTRQFVEEDLKLGVNRGMLGYLLERLFGYWIQKANLKTYVLDYIETGERL